MNEYLISNRIPNTYGAVSNQLGTIFKVKAKSIEEAIDNYNKKTNRYNCDCIGEVVNEKVIIYPKYLEIIKLGIDKCD